MNNELFAALYESWWHDDRINFWRHTRLMDPALSLLTEFGDRSWLTLGDGAGTDAWRLEKRGFKHVVATDLDSTVLERTQRDGRIKSYAVANAEQLDFNDSSFDFVLCKEVLHHMARPYLGIYEAIRVAKYAVCIIEPLDAYAGGSATAEPFQPFYESVGNFVYGLSIHEARKISYGQNLLGFGFNTLVDVYIPGCEFKLARDNEPMWHDIQAQVRVHEQAVDRGLQKPNYIQVLLFKSEFQQHNLIHLSKKYSQWKFEETNKNPHLR